MGYKREEFPEGIGSDLYNQFKEKVGGVENGIEKMLPFDASIEVGRNPKIKSELSQNTPFRAEVDPLKPFETSLRLEHRLSKRWSFKLDGNSKEGRFKFESSW